LALKPALPVATVFSIMAINGLRHSGMRRRRRPGIHTPDRGYGFSGAQLRTLARASRAPE
jgi:hypothetical protein